MKLKKLTLLVSLLAVGLVGCGAETSDPDTPEEPIVQDDPNTSEDPTVEPDPEQEEPTDQDDPNNDPTDDPNTPEDPTVEPDPDPEPEEPVDPHEEALKNLKELETVVIEGTYINAYNYDEGAGTDRAYYYSLAGIYTTDYVWSYYEYLGSDPNGSGTGYQNLVVNYEGYCASESVNRYNQVEYEVTTNSSGEPTSFTDSYYQPFSYVTKEATAWNDDTSTLTIIISSVSDSVALFKSIFTYGRVTPTALYVTFDEDYQPVTISCVTSTRYDNLSYTYTLEYNGTFVTEVDVEDKLTRATPYERYENIDGLEAILEELLNASSYKVYSADAPEYMYGLFDKDKGVVQVNPSTGTTGTLKVDDEKYVTFTSVDGTTVNANSGNITGNAYDGYFENGGSGTVPDYKVAAELFEYVGDGKYQMLEEFDNDYFPYLIPAYRFLEEYYGSGSIVSGSYYDYSSYTYVDCSLEISGTASEPVMSFYYRTSSYVIYPVTIVFTDLNSTTIPYTATDINYPTKWSDALGDVSSLNLSINSYDTNGTLSFDDDVPFQLFDNYTWSLNNSYLSYTAVELYLEVDTLDTAKSMLDEYYSSINNNQSYSLDADNRGDETYSATFKNEAGTLGIKLEAISGTTNYLDLCVYGLGLDGYGSLITNILGETTVSNYETTYSMTLGVDEIDEVYPYVNPSLGFGTASRTSYLSQSWWSIEYVARSSRTNLQTYIDDLNDAVTPSYEADGWVMTSSYSSYYGLTEYSWTKTVDGTTYTLSVMWGVNSSYYYAVSLRFTSAAAE